MSACEFTQQAGLLLYFVELSVSADSCLARYYSTSLRSRMLISTRQHTYLHTHPDALTFESRLGVFSESIGTAVLARIQISLPNF